MLEHIGFVGLGNMGRPMVHNLLDEGYPVSIFDLRKEPILGLVQEGGIAAAAVNDVAPGARVLVTMLPDGAASRAVWLGASGDGSDGLMGAAEAETLLIDCSTIDVATARDLHSAAESRGLAMLDAPVSGGVAGAEAKTLTFMVGGGEAAFARAEPILAKMGRTIVHAGGPGNGQAAKICNNLILGISMIAVSEAFVLADRLGLDRQRLFDIVANASGQCWSLTSYCPVPGPVPASPANRGYAPGFTARMMLKDLGLAYDAAQETGAQMVLGAAAEALYRRLDGEGRGDLDFSGIITMLAGGGADAER